MELSVLLIFIWKISMHESIETFIKKDIKTLRHYEKEYNKMSSIRAVIRTEAINTRWKIEIINLMKRKQRKFNKKHINKEI